MTIPPPPTASIEATKEMCYMCFEELYRKQCRGVRFGKRTTLEEKNNFPLYVKWTGEDKEACGAVGSMTPGYELSKAIPIFACLSSCYDPRFKAIELAKNCEKEKGFHGLTCDLKLFHSFKKVTEPEAELTKGKYGLAVVSGNVFYEVLFPCEARAKATEGGKDENDTAAWDQVVVDLRRRMSCSNASTQYSVYMFEETSATCTFEEYIAWSGTTPS